MLFKKRFQIRQSDGRNANSFFPHYLNKNPASLRRKWTSARHPWLRHGYPNFCGHHPCMMHRYVSIDHPQVIHEYPWTRKAMDGLPMKCLFIIDSNSSLISNRRTMITHADSCINPPLHIRDEPWIVMDIKRRSMNPMPPHSPS